MGQWKYPSSSGLASYSGLFLTLVLSPDGSSWEDRMSVEGELPESLTAPSRSMADRIGLGWIVIRFVTLRRGWVSMSRGPTSRSELTCRRWGSSTWQKPGREEHPRSCDMDLPSSPEWIHIGGGIVPGELAPRVVVSMGRLPTASPWCKHCSVSRGYTMTGPMAHIHGS